MSDERDYSKNYAWAEQLVKTKSIILVKADWTEVSFDADLLEDILALLD